MSGRNNSKMPPTILKINLKNLLMNFINYSSKSETARVLLSSKNLINLNLTILHQELLYHKIKTDNKTKLQTFFFTNTEKKLNELQKKKKKLN
jgi:hypothetical protein